MRGANQIDDAWFSVDVPDTYVPAVWASSFMGVHMTDNVTALPGAGQPMHTHASDLYDDTRACVEKYEDRMLVATAVGLLETVKLDLVEEAKGDVE